MNASAVSATTSALRARHRAVPPEPFLSTSISCGEVSCSAGASPARSPAPIEATSAKASTAPSMCTSSSRGMSGGASASSAPRIHGDASTTSSPPSAASTRASTIRWRTSAPRPAPSAARMASSRCRAIPRASSSDATLAQAISSASSTAPKSAVSAGFTGPIRSSSSGCASIRQPACSPICAWIRGADTSNSACASPTEAPGLSRATPVTQFMPRNSFSLPSIAIGSSTSAWRRSGKWKSAGITPPTW